MFSLSLPEAQLEARADAREARGDAVLVLGPEATELVPVAVPFLLGLLHRVRHRLAALQVADAAAAHVRRARLLGRRVERRAARQYVAAGTSGLSQFIS